MSEATVLRREAKPRVGCCDEVVARSVAVLEERLVGGPRDWTHLQYCNAPAVAGTTRCPRHTERPNRGLRYAWQRFARRG